MSCHKAVVHNINLKPGAIFFADTPHIVSTLLGSCVAITLFAPTYRVGAICHALLPMCREGKNYDCPEKFRHVSCSLRGMLAMFRERGISCSLIESKIFGGADMFPNEPERKREGYRFSVGQLNIAKAEEMLATEGIRIIAADVGGGQGRKILFRPHTGEVFLQRMNRMVDRETWGGSVP
jgi:chemotaxis protein CheD